MRGSRKICSGQKWISWDGSDCVGVCVFGEEGGNECVKLLKLEKGELGAKQAKLLNVKRQGHL